MENLEIIFALLLAAVLLVGFAQKIGVPYPIVLILGGAMISFIPGIEGISFDPKLILAIFLPPILYYSAFGISFREFQKNWQNIFSLALGLVALTTVVVGVIFKYLFPQVPWGLAFAFGAIISPPDAISVTSILKRFSINPSLITLLEGESLVNDASAIVIYKMAIIALMTGLVSLNQGIFEFVYIVGGGVLVGFILGFLFQEFSRRYLEPLLGVVFSFIIPYATYMIADNLGVSGILAVVVNGLIGSRILRKHHSSLRRIVGFAFWDVWIILLNCFVFILMGLQIKTIAEKMSNQEILLYSGYAFLIALTMVVVRFIWVYGRATIFYLLHRKTDSGLFKESAIVGWAGMRGIVSLALALALPYELSNGMPLEGRNEVVFITFVVIFFSLIIPGLTLPSLIYWLKSPIVKDDSYEQEIRNLLRELTLEKINHLLASKKINLKEFRTLKSYFNLQNTIFEMAHEKNPSNIEIARRDIIHFQRSKLIEIWERHQIDDKLLTHFVSELDMMETHIARAELIN